MNKPNVLIFICHDLGKHLGCYGVPTVNTPNLDAFAADGVRFDSAYCTAPQCSPSRASLFTGRYPHSNGVMGLTHQRPCFDLHANEKHLASYLKDAGYDTALIGLQHETARPQEMGYDVIVKNGANCSANVASAAIEYLDTRKDNHTPFYMQVGVREPHRPFIRDGIEADNEKGEAWIPPFIKDEPSSRQDFAEFQGSIREMDKYFGVIIDKLKALNLDDNTLVMFTTDHGMPFPMAKCSVYDAGLDISQIIRFPSRGWVGGKTVTDLTSNVDVLPTVLDVIERPIPSNIHGRSFSALLDGKAYTPRTEIFGEMTFHTYYDPLRCVRTPEYKLIVCFSNAPFYMNPAQLFHPLSEDNSQRTYPVSKHAMVELYDLTKEDWEQTNLADDSAYAKIRAELLGKIHTWMTSTGDPLLKGAITSPFHDAAVALLANADKPLNG